LAGSYFGNQFSDLPPPEWGHAAIICQVVPFVAAAMVAPALIALYRIRAHEIDPARAHGGRNKHDLLMNSPGILSPPCLQRALGSRRLSSANRGICCAEPTEEQFAI
jgi:hypothetical protein